MAIKGGPSEMRWKRAYSQIVSGCTRTRTYLWTTQVERGERLLHWVGLSVSPIVGSFAAFVYHGGFEGQHTTYWAQYEGHYEHWRFSKGYDQGWEDAYRFLSHDIAHQHVVSELGFQGLWKKKRVRDHGVENGFSNNLWEYGKALGLVTILVSFVLVLSSLRISWARSGLMFFFSPLFFRAWLCASHSRRKP